VANIRQQFISAVHANQPVFGLELSRETIERLADYFEFVQENNALLHLVGPCSEEEFAVRHVLESLMLLDHLPKKARFADVGAGAGLPSIPCLIVRDDLAAVLIENKQKKAAFLEEVLARLGLSDRAAVLNRQFEEVTEKDFSHVTCRALDKFTNKLPRLLKWSGKRANLLFGGPALSEALNFTGLRFERILLPLSHQRFLFIQR
jgi:16S rRNA (guanine(527)-N(7))-methyltransferase RsmG